jgi:LPXTG-motif cell wall-anchored protein
VRVPLYSRPCTVDAPLCAEEIHNTQEAQDYFDSRGPGDPDNLDADDDGIPCEELEGDDSSQQSVFQPNDEDTSGDDTVGADQYEDEDRQEAVETPQTGGPALLPLAGAMLLLSSGGYLLVRR